MVVVAVIGLLATLALPALGKARERSAVSMCKNNQRQIYDAICRYCFDTPTGMVPSAWPNLCAARDRLAPGGEADYLRNWEVFECPVTDTQDQHDYAYVFEDGQMAGVRCNNISSSVRNLHNATTP